MLRIGVGPTAAGLAAFAIGFISYLWLTPDTETANAGVRAEANDLLVSGTIRPKRIDLRTTTASSDIRVSDTRDNDRVQLASLQPGQISEVAFEEPDNRSAQPSSRLTFGERFSFDEPSLSNPSPHPSHLSASFQDRFTGSVLAPSATVQFALAPQRTATPSTAAAVPVPRPAPRSVVAQATSKQPSKGGFQLASASATPVSLAYAPSDPAKGSGITGPTPNGLTPNDSDPSADIDTSRTAIYDITSRTVYLPNGRRLEAHSGLGGYMDDPRYVHLRGTGPTPPNIYDLRLRERLFHGVRAIRLVPTDGSKMYGRDGMLAHSYMLGANGQSNGCVSFKDYDAFLEAFDRGEVNRLVVVERLADAPSPKTAADWLSNTLKDLFRRS